MKRYIVYYPKIKGMSLIGSSYVTIAKSKKAALLKFKRNSFGYKFQPHSRKKRNFRIGEIK